MTGAFFFFGVIGSIKGAEPLFIIAPLAVMIIAAFVVFKKLLFDLVDEVCDDGDALVVRNKHQEERIPLSQIINVSDSFLTSPPRITLTMREATRFGKNITFMPPVRVFSFSRNPMVSDLIERIDQARLRQV